MDIVVKGSNQTLRVFQSLISENPREWGEYYSNFISLYKGNLCDLTDANASDMKEDLQSKEFTCKEDAIAFLERKYNCLAFPIYGYSHCGLSISLTPFSCSFDSGIFGYITLSKEYIREEYGVKKITKSIKTDVFNALSKEINSMDVYINDEVYEYTITDNNDNDNEIANNNCFEGCCNVDSGLYNDALTHSDKDLTERIKKLMNK